jgi:hypothetical protein
VKKWMTVKNRAIESYNQMTGLRDIKALEGKKTSCLFFISIKSFYCYCKIAVLACFCEYKIILRHTKKRPSNRFCAVRKHLFIRLNMSGCEDLRRLSESPNPSGRGIGVRRDAADNRLGTRRTRRLGNKRLRSGFSAIFWCPGSTSLPLREPPGNNLPIDRSLSLSLVLSLSKGRAREVGKLFLAASLKWIAFIIKKIHHQTLSRPVP